MLTPARIMAHVTYNNTIYGTHYNTLPDFGDATIVTDMSSCILSEGELSFNKFGLVYAGAQENIGPAGVTIVVVVRDDLIGNAMDITPTMLNYETHSKKRLYVWHSADYAIYICGLVYEWIKDMGGVKVMHGKNVERAEDSL